MYSIISFITLSFANVGFFGSSFEINNNVIELESNIVNRDNSVKSQITVHYQLRSVDDLTIFYEYSEEYSLAPFEVKKLFHSINSSNLPSENYFLNIHIRSGSGTPLTHVTHEITLENNNLRSIKFSTLPFLRVFYTHSDNRIRFEDSKTTIGRPVVPNETFEVRFELENSDLNSQDLNLEILLRNSFNRNEELELLYSELISINGSQNLEVIRELQYDKAGTYDLFVVTSDLNGNLLTKREVRLVIIGEAGTILDVFNRKDTYLQGETVNFDVTIVGPADGLSLTTDNNLKVEIFKSNELIQYVSQDLTILPQNPEIYSFNFPAIENLEFYTARITLYKEDRIFDVVELRYEPLEAELIISPDGRVYNPNVIACFDDGICTEQERVLGNCLDCLEEDREQFLRDKESISSETIYVNNYDSENFSSQNNTSNFLTFFSLIVIVLSLMLIIGLLLMFKNNRNNQKINNSRGKRK